MTIDEISRQWVDDNGDWFEKAILWFAIHDEGLWKVLAPLVCVASDSQPVKDFSIPLHTAVYRLVAGHRLALGTRMSGRLSRESFALAVNNAAASGKLLGISEVTPAMVLYDELTTQSYLQLKEVLQSGLGYWLAKQRTGILVTSLCAKRDWSANTLMERMSVEIGNVNRRMSPTTHISEFTTSIMTRKTTTTPCLTSGLHGLDMLLGGGFHDGDGHLIIAATGVGKTVAFMQLASEFALNGHIVAAITTEQPMAQLEPRVISNRCNIPFDQIGRGFTLQSLTTEQRQRASRLLSTIANRLFVFDWGKQRKSVLSGGIEEEINYCRERTGKCDVVLLDWLGGALTDDVKDDKDKKRLAIQNTADRMAEVAREFEIPTITFCQAHKVHGINNMCVGVKEVPDCKTVDQKVATVIGITGMLSKEARERIKQGDSPHGVGLYDQDQYFYVSKGRFSVGGHARFKRDFKYQRMTDA
jgi:hypothetical protein